MDFLDVIHHLFNFTAPAAFVAIVTAFLAPRLLLGKLSLPGFRPLAGACFLASVLVLVAGLWVGGRDGRMVTYAAMVVACGSVPWVLARAWRS